MLESRRTAVGCMTIADGMEPREARWLAHRWGEAPAAFAAGEGCTLGAVFSDVRGRGEPGLYVLIGRVRRTGAAAVIVPDLRHRTRAACLTRAAYLAGADPLTVGRFLHAPVLAVEGALVRTPAASRSPRCCRTDRRPEQERGSW